MMWVTPLHEQGHAPLAWGVVLAAAAVAAAWDLRSRRIPNALTLPLLAGGLLQAGLVAGAAGLLESLAACVLLALPFVVLFAIAHGGAGDAKLMGAICAWLGLHDGALALVAVCLSGVVLATAWALARRRLPEVRARLTLLAHGLLHLPFRRFSGRELAACVPPPGEGLPMPYAPAILAGCLLACGASLA
jgi:Flp pilus assembly protein protease CpaA